MWESRFKLNFNFFKYELHRKNFKWSNFKGQRWSIDQRFSLFNFSKMGNRTH